MKPCSCRSLSRYGKGKYVVCDGNVANDSNDHLSGVNTRGVCLKGRNAMPRSFCFVTLFAAVLVLILQAVPVQAQATRTWVSGVGDNANPCSRTAPCQTFAGAISKTAAGGEISVLDPGGFGPVTITKSISIVAEGSEGAILAALGDGITINAGPTDVVSLHGLFIEGAGTGSNGIRFLAGGTLHVRKCLIRGFRADGGLAVDIQAPGPSKIFIADSTLTANLAGILVKPTGLQPVVAFLDRVQIEGNSGVGITSDGATAEVRISDSTVTNNGTGLSAVNGGQLISFKNNALGGNTVDGSPTMKMKLK
jgi:hypothetical protein